MTNDKLLSQTISFLRFPLIVGVAFLHFNLLEGLPVSGTIYGLNYPEWYFYLMQFFSNVVPSIVVPLFFFISGFLFFYHTEFCSDAYKRKLHTRIKTLLIPFLLWNTITLLLKSARILPFIASLDAPIQGMEFRFSWIRLFNTFFNYDKYNGILVTPDAMAEISTASYPIAVPMWYVRDLMVMVLLAPAIYWMMKRKGAWIVISIGIIKYCVIPILLPHGGYPSQFVFALFFFSWGAYFSINRQNFVETMRQYKYLPFLYLPVAIIDTLTKRTDYNLYFHDAGVLLGIASVVIVASYLVEKEKVRVNPTLANASFFIYALHPILLNPLGRVIIMTLHLSENTLVMLAFYFGVPTITIILCLGIYIMLRRYLPNVWILLTGGR